METGNLAYPAVDEIATAARRAHPAIAAEPADANSLPDFPGGDVSTDRVDTAGDFMARYDRVFDAGKGSFDR
jgi:hypothetical protein